MPRANIPDYARLSNKLIAEIEGQFATTSLPRATFDERLADLYVTCAAAEPEAVLASSPECIETLLMFARLGVATLGRRRQDLEQLNGLIG